MNSDTLFFTLVAVTIGWIALPFLPAIRELFAPRDAAPLDAVGRDAGPLTYFAESFRTVVDQAGYARGAGDQTRLPDGRRVMVIADQAPQTLDDEIGLLVGAHRTHVPDGATLPVETFGTGELTLGDDVATRAIYGAGAVKAGARLRVLRWLHGDADVTIGPGSQLAGRATSRSTLRLAPDVQFDRLQAARIAVGTAADRATGATGEASLTTSSTMPVFEPRGSGVGVMASQHWRIDGDLEIPAAHRVWGTLVVRGTLWIGAGAEIRGSVKAHRTVHVGEGAVVYGTVAAREDVLVNHAAEVRGTVIAEGSAIIGTSARIGRFEEPAAISADLVTLRDGCIVYGAISARRGGRTTA